MTVETGRSGRRLVIFDLCDTLYDVNTTVGFVDYYQSAQQAQHIARTLRRWSSKASPWFYLGAIADRFFGADLARRRIIGALAGEPRTKLAAAAADYARNILSERANEPLHDRLTAHIAAGDHVMLLSSSLDVVVGEIAALLGVDYRASKLGFDGDRCTGKLKRDLTGRKSAAIRDLLEGGISLSVYTDNRTDRDLVAIADRAAIVVPRGKPLVRWGGQSCEYIRL